MSSSRTILIVGAGIGGLTSALTLARAGYRVVMSEQAPQLSDIGAGIQLSPNATRILIGLGIAERLASKVTVPEGLSIRTGRTGREIVYMPLGKDMDFHHGAPYWIVHRGDLQAALAAAVAEQPDVIFKLGTRLDDFTLHAKGITALSRGPHGVDEERGIGLVGADGLWSATRDHLHDNAKPEFRNRTAWRATLSADALSAEMRSPIIRLWLGANAHLVTYPLRGGALINVVAIVRDRWNAPGWSAAGQADELMTHFSPRAWAPPARDLLRICERWTKWALFDSERTFYGSGPVTLVGDAAHPMLPFLAQGAGMAIEDAAILGRCLAATDANPEIGMRRYEAIRGPRVRRVQREARDNGRRYHMSGLPARARDLAMRVLGGRRLRARYHWLYDWRPD
ncbi:MAG: FAD-dependent monooxygenase [Pseudorhodoplanes sp.]